ncbi:hypothetical protein CYMTET_10673 [Cymbomonas tetramitiformis]|uniref:Endonuclease/exonuclease/phosphatase domain-containing protein n=1 Tax=Cymbomonas tetramitiformis TaxID=36881 RepID=A0AAE0GPA6_9CHLO|nr:hypothetical protein CYMTET_10673 [Cymbomonas tetramitiformis]
MERRDEKTPTGTAPNATGTGNQKGTGHCDKGKARIENCSPDAAATIRDVITARKLLNPNLNSETLSEEYPKDAMELDTNNINRKFSAEPMGGLAPTWVTSFGPFRATANSDGASDGPTLVAPTILKTAGKCEGDAENSSTSTQVGVFHNEGRLNMMHVDAVNEHFDKDRHADSNGYTGGEVQLLTEQHQYDGYNCGVWVLYVGRKWREWHEGDKATDWRREMEQLANNSGDALQEMMNGERREYRPLVYREIMRNRETAMEEGTPGEVTITGTTQQHEGNAGQEETREEQIRPRKGKRIRKGKGELSTVGASGTSRPETAEDGKVKNGEEGRKRTNTEKETTEENMGEMGKRTDKWAMQKKTKYAPQETITALLPRWEAERRLTECQEGTDEDMVERSDEGENDGTHAAPTERQDSEWSGERAARRKKAAQQNNAAQPGGNQPTQYRGKPYQTEPKDEEGDREDGLNILTWNIGGRRDAGYDICHTLEQRKGRQEEDVHVIVLTEVKTAHRDVMHKFRDMGYTAVGTEVVNAVERKRAEQARARGGVVTLLGGPYGHVHNHHVELTPHLEGYLLHTVLHLPDNRFVHVVATYSPPHAEEAGVRNKIQDYIATVRAETSGAENVTMLVGGDLQASNTSDAGSRTAADKSWDKLTRKLNMTDVGPETNTTLEFAQNRNIDRFKMTWRTGSYTLRSRNTTEKDLP